MDDRDDEVGSSIESAGSASSYSHNGCDSRNNATECKLHDQHALHSEALVAVPRSILENKICASQDGVVTRYVKKSIGL